MTKYTLDLHDGGAEITLTEVTYDHDCWGRGERHVRELSYVFTIRELETVLDKLNKHVTAAKSKAAARYARIRELKNEITRLENENV